MAEREDKAPGDQPTVDDKLKRRLEDAAEAVRRPHDDAEERERRRKAAKEAERSPRRQGEGIHPGTH
jgi:hypothetical protein